MTTTKTEELLPRVVAARAAFEAWATATNQGYDLTRESDGRMQSYRDERTEHAWRGYCSAHLALTQRPAAQTEREAFEEWYAEDANKQTGKPGWFTPKSIAELRDGDGYGEHRVMLNGKWEGWQARASLPAPQQATPASAPQSLLMRLAGIAAECSDPDTTDALDALIADTQQATPDDSFTAITYQTNDIGFFVDATEAARKQKALFFVNGFHDSVFGQSTPGWSYTQTRRVDENTVDIGRMVAFEDEQATPEPVGEPAAWRWFNSNGDQVTNWLDFKAAQKASVEAQVAEAGGRIEYAYPRPAPGVPEDVQRDAERYRFIRDANRSDCITREISLYAMESLDEYVDAAMEGETAALAAAQAKGGE